MKNTYLFVYGSLMHDSPHPVAEYLREQAEFMGEGKMRGEKFELGGYTGTVYLPKAETWVEGHVFRLSDPEKTLSVLDDYEEIGENYPQPNEYIRRECPIFFGDNSQLDCQVYLYNLQSQQPS